MRRRAPTVAAALIVADPATTALLDERTGDGPPSRHALDAPAVCFDGRDLIDAEPDACVSWAVTSVPRDLWAPDATPDQYPDPVPCCAIHAGEVWTAAGEGAFDPPEEAGGYVA